MIEKVRVPAKPPRDVTELSPMKNMYLFHSWSEAVSILAMKRYHRTLIAVKISTRIYIRSIAMQRP